MKNSNRIQTSVEVHRFAAIVAPKGEIEDDEKQRRPRKAKKKNERTKNERSDRKELKWRGNQIEHFSNSLHLCWFISMFSTFLFFVCRSIALLRGLFYLFYFYSPFSLFAFAPVCVILFLYFSLLCHRQNRDNNHNENRQGVTLANRQRGSRLFCLSAQRTNHKRWNNRGENKSGTSTATMEENGQKPRTNERKRCEKMANGRSNATKEIHFELTFWLGIDRLCNCSVKHCDISGGN